MIAYKHFEVFHNTRVKYYADGSVKLSVANGNIYKDSDFVVSDSSTLHNSCVSNLVDEETFLARQYKYRNDSIKRSKNKVFDIVKMNDWDFFFTGTISDDCDIDRYNADEVSKKVNSFMYNLVKRGKIIRYLFVPEYHEDGAVHYHGFIKASGSLSFRLALNPRTGKPIRRGKNRNFVFNWSDWTFGFSTLIHCYGSVDNMSKYFCKYITKSSYFPMKHRYYCGGSVVRDVPLDYFDLNFDDVPCDVISTDFGQFKFLSFDCLNDFHDFLLCYFTQFDNINIFKGGYFYVV